MSFFRRLSRKARARHKAAPQRTLKRPDVQSAEFFAAYDALRAQLAAAPTPALSAAANRILRDWARFSEAHGLPLPEAARPDA